MRRRRPTHTPCPRGTAEQAAEGTTPRRKPGRVMVRPSRDRSTPCIGSITMRTTAAAMWMALVLTGCGAAQVGSGGPAPDPSDEQERPALNVGSWTPGDLSMLARGGGRVSVDDAGCVHLQVAGRAAVDVVWPAGYSVDERAGRVVVRNARGDVVVREGDAIVVGGGFAHSDELRCHAGESGGVFHVQQRLRPRASAA